MPKQKRWMPNRQQKRSQSLGAVIGYFCVNVMPTQIMAAPSQKILPLRVRLVPRGVVVQTGAVVEGQRGLDEPQSRVLARAKMQEEKLLATTTLPIPITGRQLSAYEMQQLMIHAGRAGGFETTFYQWRIMQLTKMLRKMKQASKQQNSTSVYPTSRIIPTPQPNSKKWMLLKKPLTQLSTFVPSPRVIAQKIKSMMGQEQMTMNLLEQSPKLLQQSWQSEGSRKAYEKQRKAMISKGIRKLPRARPFSLALTNTTMPPNTTQNPQKRYSLQKLSAKIVSSMSTVSSTRIKVTTVPMRSPLPSYRLTTWYANTISDNFHSNHEQIRLMATPTAELGPLMKLLNMPVESVQLAYIVSVKGEIEKALLQQQEACVPTAKQSMAHNPMLMPIARMQRQSWMKQFDLDGASSRSSTYLPPS